MQTRDKHDNDNVRRIFEAIARDTIDNGGGTYQHKTGTKIDLHARYGSGYVVSVAEYGETIAAPIASLGERIARVWPSHIGASVQYVGTWLHRGLVFIDGSVVLPESARDIALALARKHGQTAIFNIRTGQSEYVRADKPTADDVYAAIRAIVGDTTPETAHLLPRVSVRLCGASLDDVIARVFGADAWIDSNPVDDDDDDGDDVFCIYNDTLLPDDQSGAYTYDEATDVLTVWGFYGGERCECGAPLAAPGAVAYGERYDATLHGGTLWVQSDTVDSVARCAACGAALPLRWEPAFT